MKQRALLFRIFAVILTLCFVLSSTCLVGVADDSLNGMSDEEKKAVIEQRLREVNEKLDQLGEKSQETQEYIDALDEKISYLNKELTLSQNEIDSSKDKISSLELQYKKNEKEIAKIKSDLVRLEGENKELRAAFDEEYELYGKRLRAMYISGETSVISIIISSADISTLLTRLEMIKRVSESDTKLLKSITSKVERLSSSQQEMAKKQTKLTNEQKTLVATQVELEVSISDLQLKQSDFEDKQKAYKEQKAESDEKLRKLHEQENTYSEYRNQDQAELNEINASIVAAAEEMKKKLEAEKATSTTAPQTTAPTTTTTTATTTTTTQSSDDSQSSTTAPTTTTKPTTTTTQPTTTSNPNRLSLTYPVPSQPRITCAYGSAGYSGHTGVDFSCPTGSKVVAAESGYVVISTDLTNADGSYRSYGRYIVIMHDKLDSSGNYVYTLYAHNSERLVSSGQYVTKGQAIAYSGSTGNSTGPHCHFEVRTPTADYGCCVDPTPYLP